jgi:antitoxin ParD1/3/4
MPERWEQIMPKNTSFVLGEHFEGFIVEEVASGRYGNASDVMRAALRLLEHEEKKLEALRVAIVAGDVSPESEDSDGEKVFSRLRRKTGPKSRRG